MRNVLTLPLSVVLAIYPQQPAPQSPPPTPAPVYAPQDAPPLGENSDQNSSPSTGEVTIPAGTKIQIYLTNPLHSRTAQVGDPVQAEVAFPVVVANQLVIPRGTFVEGGVTKVTHAGFAHRARVQMRFSRFIFENGYQLSLTGGTSEASNQSYGDALREIVADAWTESGMPTAAAADTRAPASVAPFAMLNLLAFQFPVNPPPPTLPPQKPLPGQSSVEALAIAGAVVTAAVVIIAIAHHGREFYLDPGWQLEITLQAPVTLNAAKANAPISVP